MYAIVEIGGKQYKVEKDMMLNVDRMRKEKGESITIDKVLMFVDEDNISIGQPYLENVKITAEVFGDVKGKKVR